MSGHLLKYVLKNDFSNNKTEIFVPKICYLGYHGNGSKDTGNSLLELLFHLKATIHGISVKSERCHFPRFPL